MSEYGETETFPEVLITSAPSGVSQDCRLTKPLNGSRSNRSTMAFLLVELANYQTPGNLGLKTISQILYHWLDG